MNDARLLRRYARCCPDVCRLPEGSIHRYRPRFGSGATALARCEHLAGNGLATGQRPRLTAPVASADGMSVQEVPARRRSN
jgi:hypothetical protein